MQKAGVGISRSGRRGRRVLCAALGAVVAVTAALAGQPLWVRATSGYAGAVIADSPTVYYRLGEAAGASTAVDSSGNGNNGTYTGSGFTYGAAGAIGDGDTAMGFAPGSTANYVSSTYVPGTVSTFSAEAWVYVPAALPNGYVARIAGYSQVPSTHQGFDWLFNADNTSQAEIYTSSTGYVLGSAVPAIALQKWHQLAVTYDGSSFCEYLDGVQESCQAATGSLVPDNGNILEVAATPKLESVGAGINIDEFAYYTHALTAARVLTHYESRTPSVSSITPTHGTAAGGTSVTVSGFAFTGATAVTFGGVAASSFTVTNDSTITATAPAASSIGSVDVQVTTPGGQTVTSASDQYAYDRAATSAATPGSSVNPSSYTQSVTFSTTVSGGGSTPTGTVTWTDSGVTLGTSSLGAGGSTTYTTSALGTGNHSIVASYGGDTAHLGSTSAALSQGVGLGTPVVGTPTSSVNPSKFGQATTFTVTVSGPGVTPTGTVTWQDGATVLATTAVTSGSAQLSTAVLTAGTHSVTAVYSGDSNYSGGTSAAVSQVVDKSSTSTGLTAAPNPATAGQTVTYTANVTAVSPGAGTPTGTVTFYDGATSIGTTSLDASATTSLSLTEAGGSHTITATYNSDGNFTGSTSSPVVEVVNPGASSTSQITPSANPSTYGSSLTLAVTITGPPFTPTGSVTFKDGSTVIGSGTLDASGKTSMTTSTLTGGSHSLTATYSGDSNHVSSTSATLSETISRAAPVATTPASSVNPSTYGQSVAFSTTVSGAGITPTGTVTWLDGAAILGTSTLGSGGATSFSTTALAAGSHGITASYAGDGNYAAVVSAAVTQVVRQSATAEATPTSSQNPSIAGVTVTYTETVTAVAPGAGTPTGSVAWFDGGTPLGSTTLNASGTTTLNVAEQAGPHTITAQYAGDSNFSGGTSGPLAQVTNQASSTMSPITPSANPSTYGTPLTLTVTVTGPPLLATGTVTFRDGNTVIGGATLDSTGTASMTISGLVGGTHSITASYSGDRNHVAASSATLHETINKATPATPAPPTSSADPSTYGTSVTFTVTLRGAGATPTGTVTWMDGSQVLGTSPVDAAGNASFSTSTLDAGSHSITAVYGGDQDYNGVTSRVLTDVVNPSPSTLSAPQSSANPSGPGQPVTFTVTVTRADALGTVTWTDGRTTLGTTTVNTGRAAFTTSQLALGTHPIAASYSGDSDHTGATSPATAQVVTDNPPPPPPLQDLTPPVVPPAPPAPPSKPDTGQPTRPVVTGGDTAAPVAHADPTAGQDRPPSFFAAFVGVVGNAALRSAFPLILILLALIFLAVQDRIDRKDPKLALAPARPDPQLSFPSPISLQSPRGTAP